MFKISKTSIDRAQEVLRRRILSNRFLLILSIVVILSAVLFIPFPKQETLIEEVSFTTNRIEDSSIELGKVEARQDGENGLISITYRYNQSFFNLLFNRSSRPQRHVVSEDVIQEPRSRIVASGTMEIERAVESAPLEPMTSDSSDVAEIDCSQAYIENTQIYQDFWSYHLDSVNSSITEIHEKEHLTHDQKNEQINRWARYFNDRVDELVAIWKKSMEETGCGGRSLGFSPGYMPIIE